MAVTFTAADTKSARRYKLSGGRSENTYTALTGSTVGWSYMADGYYTNQYGYRAGLEMDGELPSASEPASADASTAQLKLTLEASVSMALAVGILGAAIPDGAQSRYNALGENTDIVGTISAGSTSKTFSLTRVQAANALAYGVKVFPSAEFGTSTSKASVTGAQIVYTEVNPAARGRVSDLTPGNYSSIVGSAANTISYTYHHDAGGYAQAYLSVIAKNQDTGEVVTICRKASVSVSDGARGSFTIAANALTAGRWTMTVCAAPSDSANYYGDSSDFWVSGQTFTYVVRDNPSSSSVTCDGKPVPTVSWTSVSQAAYQVRFGDYDSGARTGSGTSFTVPRIFEDGSYPARVRTASSTGEWTPWTETEYVTIANTAPTGNFGASAAQDGVNARIWWAGDLDTGTWEQGAIQGSGSSAGQETVNSKCIRTGYIPIVGSNVRPTAVSGMRWIVCFFSSPEPSGYLRSVGWRTGTSTVAANGARYIRLEASYSDNTAILPEAGEGVTATELPTVSAVKYAIFRDGEMIAVVDGTEKQYVDRIGAGGTYEVLAVTSGMVYATSGKLALRLKLPADLLSTDGGYSWLRLKLTPERKNQPEDYHEDVTFAYYAGDEKPAAFRTGQKQRTKSFAYVFLSRTAARQMRQLIGREVAIKTTRGEHIRGMITDMSWGDAKHVTASFSVREVRGEEDGVEYPT